MGEIVLYGKGKGGKGIDDPSRRIVRRTIDFGSDVVRWLQDCIMPRQSAAPWQCHYAYAREVMPPFATPERPYDSICPRFAHASTNKTRAPVHVVHWFPHGRRLLSGTQTGEMTIWNGLQFHCENILQAHNAGIRAMQWNPEENVLVSGDQLGIIKFWDQYIYNFQTFQGHKDAICDISVSPTGLKFCSCAEDSHAKVWDLRTGDEERAFTGHGWDVKCCDWHPTKGLVATGSKDSQIKLWDPRASEAITTIYCHNNTVTRVKWSPHGQFLASASRDQLVMLMDIRTMSVRKVFRGHQKEVTAICWHPEQEAVLASGGHDSNLYFWDTFGAPTPVERVIGAHEGPIWSLSWHPLGHLLASGANDYSTRFWSRARPGDANFAEILPKRIALGANEAPIVIPDDMHVGTIYQSGVFAGMPGPYIPPPPKRDDDDGTAIAAEAAAESGEQKSASGLSAGEGADRKNVLDTSDFDAEEGFVRPSTETAATVGAEAGAASATAAPATVEAGSAAAPAVAKPVSSVAGPPTAGVETEPRSAATHPPSTSSAATAAASGKGEAAVEPKTTARPAPAPPTSAGADGSEEGGNIVVLPDSTALAAAVRLASDPAVALDAAAAEAINASGGKRAGDAPAEEPDAKRAKADAPVVPASAGSGANGGSGSAPVSVQDDDPSTGGD
eukprot:CAMPEP_0170207912 /NCGR_PEP_ID=MMETSP0116_2-20130129/3535_1 /TAXON_ID=400756 /ORGANISM="Durinskia baltica, Strain CSIRO CS-38" /LENGTH=672 /DNA_ID=CAMNT_0010458373 /DNA_START=61 /DNA_END=2076 /DNA_ORIENTATION=+